MVSGHILHVKSFRLRRCDLHGGYQSPRKPPHNLTLSQGHPDSGALVLGPNYAACSLLSLRQNVSALSGPGILSFNNRLQLLWPPDGFSAWQKDGVAGSLKRFMEYAKTLSFVNTVVWKC